MVMSGSCGVPKRLKDQQGGTFGCAFMIFLVLAGGYVAYLFSIPHMHYSSFEGHLAEMVPYYKHHNAEFIQEAVIDTAKGFDVELEPEQVKVQVSRDDNRITIDIEYTRDVVLPYYTHTFTFRPHLTGQAY